MKRRDRSATGGKVPKRKRRRVLKRRQARATGGRVALFLGRLVPLPNPSEPCGGRKPVAAITDRAKRYRANSPGCRPAGPRRCFICGRRKNVGVHHVSGDESKTGRLEWACKRCNTMLGRAYKRAGVGKPTRQYNPRRKRGHTPEFTQYAWAIGVICRKQDQAAGRCSPSNDTLTRQAVSVIRATPSAKRREYSRRALEARGRWRDEIPF